MTISKIQMTKQHTVNHILQIQLKLLSTHNQPFSSLYPSLQPITSKSKSQPLQASFRVLWPAHSDPQGPCFLVWQDAQVLPCAFAVPVELAIYLNKKQYFETAVWALRALLHQSPASRYSAYLGILFRSSKHLDSHHYNRPHLALTSLRIRIQDRNSPPTGEWQAFV